jgi:tetratricopeptide (TPR) repeat protein
MGRKGIVLSRVFAVLAIVAVVGVACQSEYERHYDLAKQLRDEERLEEAIAEFKLAAEADPTKAKPWSRIASILKNQGNNEEAAEYYLKTIEIEPDYVDGYPEVVKALQRAGKLDEAEDFAKKAMENKLVKRDLVAFRTIQEQLAEIKAKREGKIPMEGSPPAPTPKPAPPKKEPAGDQP